MTQNYRPFSWEEYQKNPELLRTRGDLEGKNPITNLTILNGEVSQYYDYPIVGRINGQLKQWSYYGFFKLGTGFQDGDLVIISNEPPSETKKYHVIIKDAITGNVIDEKFVDSFCIFD